MAEQTKEQIPQQVQSLFNKGFSAFERGNLDVAIDLLLRCVELAPGFLRARKFLRAAQIQRMRKSKKDSAFAHRLSMLRGLPMFLKVTALDKAGKKAEALVASERLLSVDPVNPKFVRMAAAVADAAGQYEAAVLSLETGLEHFPDDPELNRQMGKIYEKAGNFRAAKERYEKLVGLVPHDSEALKLLKDAMARESMDRGWEKAAEDGTGARDLVRDQEQTRMLDIKTKAVKTEQDAEALIEEARAKIESDPRNMNYYRNLSRLLLQQKRFDEATEVLEGARKLNPSDPEIDRGIAGAKLQSFDHRIAQLREKGDEAGADELQHERDQFAFDDLVTRVERYPNDLRLRFELGMQYFKYDYIDEAIQQFQLSQRSPKERAESLYHLALCFRSKGQSDMALLQLEQALEVLPTMDDQRKAVIYTMGEIAEASGNMEKAAEYYKEIYRVDIGYRDISEKVEKVYAAQGSAQER